MTDPTGTRPTLRNNGVPDNPNPDSYRASSLTKTLYATTDELFAALGREIEVARRSLIPECTVVDLSLNTNAVLPLVQPGVGIYANGGTNDLPPHFKQNYAPLTYGETPRKAPTDVPHATVEVLIDADDERARSIAQRAASRGIVQGIQELDSFKYSFNNAWAANGSEGKRFAYICQDSMQNKDRHANGFNKTRKNLMGYPSRGPRKPTYDCRGSISVKFSSSRGTCDVSYRHYAIHGVATDRKSILPSQNPSSTTATSNEARAHDPSEPEEGVLSGEPAPRPQTVSIRQPAPRPRKRKRQVEQALPPPEPTRPLSLAELLQQGADQSRSNQKKGADGSNPARSIYSYEPPPWQQPLPPRPTDWRPIENPPAPPPNTGLRLRWPKEPVRSPAPAGLFVTLKQAQPRRRQHLTSHDFDK